MGSHGALRHTEFELYPYWTLHSGLLLMIKGMILRKIFNVWFDLLKVLVEQMWNSSEMNLVFNIVWVKCFIKILT